MQHRYRRPVNRGELSQRLANEAADDRFENERFDPDGAFDGFDRFDCPPPVRAF